MSKNTKKAIVDTNILVAWQLEDHKFNHIATELLKRLVIENYELIITPNIIDEVWYVLINLGKINNQKNIYKDVKKATNSILNIPNISLENPISNPKYLLETLELIEKYNLKPKDAIIIRQMRLLKIKEIVSFDTDFSKVPKITILK